MESDSMRTFLYLERVCLILSMLFRFRPNP